MYYQDELRDILAVGVCPLGHSNIQISYLLSWYMIDFIGVVHLPHAVEVGS